MRRAVILVAGSLLIAGGCSTPEVVEREETPRFLTTVERSAVREQALELLADATGSDYPQLRANALEALGRVPARARSAAAAGLADENEGVRAVAAMVVGRAGLVELSASVRPLLSDESPYVRAAAIYALRINGEEVDATELAGLLLEDDSARVRAHAAFILGELGNTSALPLLRAASRSSDARADLASDKLMRVQVAEAMAKLGDDSALQAVRAALLPARPKDLEATALAAQVVGQVGDRASEGQLIVLSAYEQQGRKMPAEVRLAAASSLALLGQRQGSFIADEYWNSTIEAVRAQSAYVYGVSGAVERLGRVEEMMSDESVLVRVAAADAVLRIVADPRQGEALPESRNEGWRPGLGG